MNYEIKTWTGKVLVSGEAESLKALLEKSVSGGADLRDAVLRDAVLRDAVLRDAVLRGADLRGAVLRGADLRGADLRDAVLRDADLTGADLRGAVLRGADLRGAVLRDADLTGADLRRADLRDAVLRDAVLRRADLRDAVLRDADLTGADLRGAVLRDADLTGADLRGAVLHTCIPIIPNIHKMLYDRLLPSMNGDGTPNTLAMESWHTCETTHCRAGHIVVMAGEAGACLEGQIGTGPAAALIYQASDPTLEKIPDWLAGNQEAWADIQRLAGLTPAAGKE